MKLFFALLTFVLAINCCQAATINAASVQADVAAKVKTSRAAVQTIFATLTNGIASVVVNSNKTTVQLSIDTNKTITSLIQSALTELLKVKNATVKAELADVQKAVNGAQALFKSFSDSLVGFRNGFWNAFSNTMSQALSDLQSTLDSFTDAAAMMIDNDNLKVAKVAGCKLTSFKLFDDLLKNATNEAAVCLKNYTAADVAFNTRVALSFKTIASIASLPLGNATLCLTINQLKTADAIDKASDCNRMSLVSCMDLSTISAGAYVSAFGDVIASFQASYGVNSVYIADCISNLQAKASGVAQKTGLSLVTCLTT